MNAETLGIWVQFVSPDFFLFFIFFYGIIFPEMGNFLFCFACLFNCRVWRKLIRSSSVDQGGHQNQIPNIKEEVVQRAR